MVGGGVRSRPAGLPRRRDGAGGRRAGELRQHDDAGVRAARGEGAPGARTGHPADSAVDGRRRAARPGSSARPAGRRRYQGRALGAVRPAGVAAGDHGRPAGVGSRRRISASSCFGFGATGVDPCSPTCWSTSWAASDRSASWTSPASADGAGCPSRIARLCARAATGATSSTPSGPDGAWSWRSTGSTTPGPRCSCRTPCARTTSPSATGRSCASPYSASESPPTSSSPRSHAALAAAGCPLVRPSLRVNPA